MKRLVISAIAIATLTGCTVESSDTRDSDVYQPAPRQTVPSKTIDDIYLGLIYGEYPFVAQMGDRRVIQLAEDICKEIDNGMTVPQLAMMAMEYGVDAEMLGFITGAGISSYCPWNSSFFDGY